MMGRMKRLPGARMVGRPDALAAAAACRSVLRCCCGCRRPLWPCHKCGLKVWGGWVGESQVVPVASLRLLLLSFVCLQCAACWSPPPSTNSITTRSRPTPPPHKSPDATQACIAGCWLGQHPGDHWQAKGQTQRAPAPRSSFFRRRLLPLTPEAPLSQPCHIV